MIKKEYIKLWEEEFDSFTRYYFRNKDVIRQDVIVDKIKSINQILSIIEKIKQLNEATVKRSELIDFVKYMKEHPDGKYVNIEEVVDSYLKSINFNGA